MEDMVIAGFIVFGIGYFFGLIGFAVKGSNESFEYSIGSFKKKALENVKMEAIENAANSESCKTRDLVIKTLYEIGCQPKFDDENDIIFQYRGETFYIEAEDSRCAIAILNKWWTHLPIDHPDIDCLKEAVNQFNMLAELTALYSFDAEEKHIGIHCRHSLLFTPEISGINNYLQGTLNSFFTAHQGLNDLYNALIEEKTKKDKQE